jgi:EmrB/QacA subfamily drug resistance transporter
MRWKAMMVIALSQLMVVLDASIVNLALPSAKADLGISDVDQQWVLTAYTLTLGSLLLLGGRVADYMGRKRAFIVGLLGFAAVSALGGIAPTPEVLFAARAGQGAFAALLAPAALALITVTFLDPAERAKAFGVFGAISGGGAAIGLLLGGVLTEFASWRWCLAVNTPIAIVAALGAVRFVRESKAPGNTSYDIPGALTATLGLLSLVYGFTLAAPKRGDVRGNWGEPETIAFLGAGVVLLIAFVVIETRVANPLLPMRVPLERNRGGSYLASLIVGAGLFAMFLFLGLYLQVIQGYSPVQAGFAFLPFSVGIILTAGIASRLLPRLGPRPLMLPGLLVSAAGMFWLSTLEVDSAYATHVLPSMILLSVGMAFVFIPMATTALHGVGSHDAGVASALINASQQVGGSIGAALLNTVAVTVTAGFLADNAALGAAAVPVGLTEGFARAFLVGGMLLLVGAVVVAAFIRIGKESLVESPDVPATAG